MTFGNYPEMNLALAREKHAQAMQKLERGIDPGAAVQEQKNIEKQEPTFAELLEEFWMMELSKTSSAKERRRLIEKDVIPMWENRKVSTIKRRDAVILIDSVRARAAVTANRLQGVMVRMLNFASERGIIDINPMWGMRKAKEKSRARVLTDTEIKTLWDCLDLERTDIDLFHVVKLALRAILLTGQRPGEVAGMRWDEIVEGVWTIPGTRTKTREENRIPINPMLADLIEQARGYSGASDFVFVSPRARTYTHTRSNDARPTVVDAHLTVGSLANGLRRHRNIIQICERFTPHDLRRTVRSKLAEIGIPDHIAEQVLGHKLQGVLGIYNRYGYENERRGALLQWEKRLQQINNDAPVIARDNILRINRR
jgi:integrase